MHSCHRNRSGGLWPPTGAPVENQTEQAGNGGYDWPQFLGPYGTGVSPEKGIIAPWPEKGLKIVWSKKIGAGYSMPVVSQGKLFHFDRHRNKARLTCMDRSTGDEAWRFEYATDYTDKYGYNNGPRCSPVVDDDRVYCHGVEGMLYCISARDGKLIWKVDTRKQFGVVQNFFGVGSTPVVEGELLIVLIGGSPPGSDQVPFGEVMGNKSGVVAFDKRTGKVRYSISDELASYASPTLATIDGRRWCFVLARGGLLAFEPASGKIDFHFPWRATDFESANASSPIVIGNQVFISETYGPGAALLKVRPGGREVIWDDTQKTKKSMQCHWMTPIHHDGYVYGSSGRHEANAELRCMELATGKVMWRVPRLTRCSLLMVDGHFICLSEEGDVRLLKVNPRDYEVVSKWEVVDPETKEELLKPPCWSAPILAHGLLYLRGDDRLVCAELVPGKK
jgi:outer membrane protein assembly factor BamB